MEDVDVLGDSSRLALTNASRSASSSISWIWLKKTALIAAPGPIGDLGLGEGDAGVGLNAGPAIA